MAWAMKVRKCDEGRNIVPTPEDYIRQEDEMDELLLIDEEMREWINKYLTKQFVGDPSEVPDDECRNEAKEILSYIHKHYATKIEEAKVRGLEAGKILGAKEEANYIIKCIRDCRRVHPEWTIDNVIDLLVFREETKLVLKGEK